MKITIDIPDEVYIHLEDFASKNGSDVETLIQSRIKHMLAPFSKEQDKEAISMKQQEIEQKQKELLDLTENLGIVVELSEVPLKPPLDPPKDPKPE